jgi:hypothetical protein
MSSRCRTPSGCPTPATRRDRHPQRVRADGDVGRVLGPRLDVNRRHRGATHVGDEGGLAVGRDRQPDRQRSDRDVGGIFRAGLTSIVDTVPPPKLVTKAVLPLGVTATPKGSVPTAMSVASFVLVWTSIVDTVFLPGGPPGPLAKASR